MNSAKYVIFDFDGTMAASVELALQIYNRIAPQYKCKQIAMGDIGRLSSANPQQFFAEYGVNRFKLLLLVFRIRRELKKQLPKLESVKNIVDVLHEIFNEGFKLGIVTSNSRTNVLKFLKNNNMADIFGFVRSANNFFGKHKVLQRLLIELKVDPRNVVYVGDETRDIVAARKVGMHIISVAWGLTPGDILETHKPDEIAYLPDELLQKIQSVFNQ